MDDNVRKADLLHEVKDLVLESVVCIFGDKDSCHSKCVEIYSNTSRN